MKDLKIYGAGLAGLIAANVLRRFNPIIIEKQLSLPHNHEALLRFRSDAVSLATSIPFKKVKVTKSIFSQGKHYDICNPRFANMYSQKVTGEIHPRSIMNLASEVRYIAPTDFIEQLSSRVDIVYGQEVSQFNSEEYSISTLPMPLNLKIAGYQIPKFDSSEISSISATIVGPQVNVYQTIYNPDENDLIYRVSLTGNRLIVEYLDRGFKDQQFGESDLVSILYDYFGITTHRPLENISTKTIKLGKIIPIDEYARKKSIYDLTTDYKVFSLGRFATWRQILLDEVVEDALVIEKLIMDPSSYSRRLHVSGK